MSAHKCEREGQRTRRARELSWLKHIKQRPRQQKTGCDVAATYRVPNGQGERINRSYAVPEAKRNGKSMEGTATTATTTRNSDKKRKANPLRVKIIP